MSGLGVDLHPYYQRGVTALPGVEYGWLKLADGAAAYIKRAEGQWWTADAHAALFRKLGVPFGGYVYAQPGDGGAEARVLWSECLRLGAVGVAPACDIESNATIHTWSVAEAIDHGRAFCSAMRKIGVRPAIYMNDSLAGATQPAAWPEKPVLWIARYGSAPQHTAYDVHQYADNGSLPGSAGVVDLNESHTGAHLLTGQTSGGGGTSPAPLEEEDDMGSDRGEATTGEEWGVLHIPVDGKQYLRLASSYGHKITVSGISMVDDTPPGAGSTVVTVAQASVVDPDRPGPWNLAESHPQFANFSHLVVAYRCAGPVKGWVNNRG